MLKLPYEMIHLAVDKVYESVQSEQDLDKSCKVIEALIVSMGWSVDEYFNRLCYGDES